MTPRDHSRRGREARYLEAERALWDSVGAQPSERFVRLERTRADVRIEEVGEGEPVVFVHGASNGATSWASLASRLSGFRCVLVDRPGCGLSPRLDRSFVDMAELGAFADDLVVDVLDAIDVAAAHLIGTSLGGYYVLRTAAAHPGRVGRVVTLSWSFGAPAASAPLIIRVANQPGLRRLATRIPVTERMARSMLKQIGLRRSVESGRFGPVEMTWFLSLLRDTDTMRNEIDAAPRLATLRGFNEETLFEPSLLRRVTAPTYLLWGEEDPMGGADIARRFASLLPNAELELMTEAGHAPWMDDPDHVAERIGAFLRGGASWIAAAQRRG